MSATISFAQAAVYQYAKIKGDFFTVSDVARETGVTELTAYRHASAFLELGIFHNRFYGPQQLFKIAGKQSPHPDLIRRIEEALPILFKQKLKRASQAKRSTNTMSNWAGSKRTNPGYAKPSGRRTSDPADRV